MFAFSEHFHNYELQPAKITALYTQRWPVGLVSASESMMVNPLLWIFTGTGWCHVYRLEWSKKTNITTRPRGWFTCLKSTHLLHFYNMLNFFCFVFFKGGGGTDFHIVPILKAYNIPYITVHFNKNNSSYIPSCAWLPLSLLSSTSLSSWSCCIWTCSSSHLVFHCCSFCWSSWMRWQESDCETKTSKAGSIAFLEGGKKDLM